MNIYWSSYHKVMQLIMSLESMPYGAIDVVSNDYDLPFDAKPSERKWETQTITHNQYQCGLMDDHPWYAPDHSGRTAFWNDAKSEELEAKYLEEYRRVAEIVKVYNATHSKQVRIRL